MSLTQDLNKRTTINSLLNPTQGPPYQSHLPPILPQPSHVQDAPAASYARNSDTYTLKTVNWEGMSDEQGRKSATGSSSRQYQHQPSAQMHPISAPLNTYNTSSSYEPRMLQRQPTEYIGTTWHPQPMIGLQYLLPPILPDSRTAMSNDFSSQGNHNSTYDEQTRSNEASRSMWQSTERVSVRLAARSQTSEPANADERSSSTYYQPPVMSEPPQQYPQQLSLPPPEDPQTKSKSKKRSLSDGDDSQAPKTKRAKPKSTKSSNPSTSAAGSSKRGYNSRKRNEAAMISAQNAVALQRAQQEANQSDANGESGSSDVPMFPELQFARCMSNRYRTEDFPRCVSCTRRWAGDTCRFQGIRFFMRDSEKGLLGVSFGQHHGRPEGPRIEFPTQWNRAFEMIHAKRVKLSIAKALLPTLEAEREHLALDNVVRRQREVDVRATCDTCMTSLFSSSWMCRVCGRELCHDCFKQVQELTNEPPNCTPAQKAMWAARREKYSHSNPFFLGCTRRIEHIAANFSPVTRFVAADLEKAVIEMNAVIEASEPEGDNPPQDKSSEAEPRDVLTSPRSPTGPPLLYHRAQETSAAPSGIVSDPEARRLEPSFPNPLTNPVYDDYVPAHTPVHISGIPVHAIQIIPADYYDPPRMEGHKERNFSDLWKRGMPLLVKNLRSRFKLPWTPEHFIDQYGEQNCLIVECQDDTNRRVSIRQFFSQFGKYEDRNQCWKLKDWPPTADFKSAYPNLYEDFSSAVPVPDYVRRDGVYNLGSHFPVNAVGPDLGPKMYNSFASSQEPGSKGSTRLHMDMADALNVMLHSSPCKDGSEGYAAWDLFKAEDSDKIRSFLRKKFALPGVSARPQPNDGFLQTQITLAHDPIHGQQFYLDWKLRQELFEVYGVKSYRVYQRPGDGVFIPAGCAHQVANMSDCMKIAIDFVSPENITRCEKLTKEFREQNQAKAWKEDVLQLRTMMWFAWLSCTGKEEEYKKQEALRMAGVGVRVIDSRTS